MEYQQSRKIEHVSEDFSLVSSTQTYEQQCQADHIHFSAGGYWQILMLSGIVISHVATKVVLQKSYGSKDRDIYKW